MSKEKGLLETINAYYRRLRQDVNELTFDAIVFQNGTLVCLDCDNTDHPPIASFLKDEKLDSFMQKEYLDHRFSTTLYEQMQQENENNLQCALDQHPEWSKKIKKAYGCLMRSGYSCGSDRITNPCDLDGKTMTFFSIHLDCLGKLDYYFSGFCCQTLYCMTSTEEDSKTEQNAPYTIDHVDSETLKKRRRDYMCPKPFAYVDKKMNVHVF